MTAGQTSRWKREIGGFAAVGIVGVVVQVGLLNALVTVGTGVLSATAGALITSTVVAWFGNRHLSFGHRTAPADPRRAVLLFCAVNAVTFGLAEAILATSYLIGAEHDRAVINVLNLAGIGVGTVIRLLAYRSVVFAEPAEPTAELALVT